MMQEFRVTKYNPARRDKNGVYTGEEWTSPSDIGQKFDGNELVIADYLAVEDAYVNAALGFFGCSKLKHLRATCVWSDPQDQDFLPLRPGQPDTYENTFIDTRIREDDRIDAEGIALLSRMILRDAFGCKFEVHGRFFIHFGWDYYMYIGCTQECADVVDAIEKSGLFVERFESPYKRPGGFNLPAKIEGSLKSDEIGVICNSIVLNDVSIAQLKRFFGYSDEHPLFGAFAMDATVVKRFQDALGVNLDTERFDYQLETAGF